MQKLIFWNPVDFTVKSTQNLIKSDVSTKTSVSGVQGGGYEPGFHEILGEIHPKTL